MKQACAAEYCEKLNFFFKLLAGCKPAPIGERFFKCGIVLAAGMLNSESKLRAIYQFYCLTA
jgi:hypothetical protein